MIYSCQNLIKKMLKRNGFILSVTVVLLLGMLPFNVFAASSSAGTVTSEVAVPESSKKWVSELTYEDRVAYEGMLKMKNSFQASLEFLPKDFHPEDSQYRTQVSKISLVFIVFGAIVLLPILLFVILRFACKKCVGPIKASQVTRTYRNLTWLIMSKA